MPGTFALVPLKAFALAKTRLAGVLTRDECALLAERMARDVLRALQATPEIAGIGILGHGPGLAALAADTGARYLPEPDGGDYRSALATAAATLARHGTRCLLVLPGDLPTLSPAAIRSLLAGHREGVTVCTAARDGGTNGLVLTPPDAIPFLFGPDSAERHLAAASAAGVAGRAADLPAFARDIDTPDDLRWLLGQRTACATLAWLEGSGVAERLRQQQKKA